MSRVFYYSGYRMTVFHWAGDELIDHYSFMPDEDGLSDFKQYLIHSPNETVKILIDVIEEDYFKDTLPHVSKRDQQAILKRRVKRNYPDSVEWFYSRVVGRETEGRKDDQVIYSVQTNPQLLAPWLEIIKQQKIAVSGIWSLSLLSEKLIKMMAIKDNNCLLLSQQVPSNLRQSFFKNGHLQTSRSAVVNLDDMSLVEHIEKELAQTSSYLANQRHIGFDEVMMVHIICPEKSIDDLSRQLEDTALRKYHYHRLEDVAKLISGVDEKEEYCHGLFSRLCQVEFSLKGQYGPNEIFRYFYKKIISKVLLGGSAAILLLSIFTMLYIQSEVIQLNKDIDVNKKYAANVELNYKKKFLPIQEELNKTTAIQSTLSFYEQLKKSKQISPESLFNYIDNLLKRTTLDDIDITAIKWSKNKEGIKGKTKAQYIDYSPLGEYIQNINIKGYLGSPSDSIESLAAKVNKLKSILKQDKRVLAVKLIRLPLDARSNKVIKNISGVDTNNENKSAINQFEIELKLKAGRV